MFIMIIRKYWAFFPSTSPFLFLCILCWWLDRLFMEFGHRRSDTNFCYHNNLQYVNMHCILTVLAVFGQSIYSIYKRKRNYEREIILLQTKKSCIFHLHILQFIICAAWSVIFACIVDVSPWLCFDLIVNKRAIYTLMSIITLFCSIYLEEYLYNKALVSAVQIVDI